MNKIILAVRKVLYKERPLTIEPWLIIAIIVAAYLLWGLMLAGGLPLVRK